MWERVDQPPTPIPFVTNSHPCKKRKGGAASVSKGEPAPSLGLQGWTSPLICDFGSTKSSALFVEAYCTT